MDSHFGLHWYWDGPSTHVVLEDLRLEYYEWAQETFLCFMGEGFAKSYPILYDHDFPTVLLSFLTDP